jgi:hypothetical protein
MSIPEAVDLRNALILRTANGILDPVESADFRPKAACVVFFLSARRHGDLTKHLLSVLRYG